MGSGSTWAGALSHSHSHDPADAGSPALDQDDPPRQRARRPRAATTLDIARASRLDAGCRYRRFPTSAGDIQRGRRLLRARGSPARRPTEGRPGRRPWPPQPGAPIMPFYGGYLEGGRGRRYNVSSVAAAKRRSRTTVSARAVSAVRGADLDAGGRGTGDGGRGTWLDAKQRPITWSRVNCGCSELVAYRCWRNGLD